MNCAVCGVGEEEKEEVEGEEREEEESGRREARKMNDPRAPDI